MHNRPPEESESNPSLSARFIELASRKGDGTHSPDFSQLSRSELLETLEVLITAAPTGDDAVDRLQRLVHEMQVYRCQLEVQNRALRDSQEENERAVHRYTELYDSLPLGYLTLSPAGQIMEANATACEALHVTREQLKGTFFRQYISSRDVSALAAHLAACNRSSLRQTMETTLTPRTGTPVLVQLSSCRAFPQAEVGFLIRTAFTDISDNKKAHQSLQEALAEQEQFTYSISHDLRGPLMRISSFATVLTEDHAPSLPGEVQDIIGRIRHAAIRMEELLSNLVQYSRIARTSDAVNTIDVNAVIREFQSEHQGLIKERRARLEIPSPLPPVLASPVLFVQAFTNLLTNALKFTAPGQAPVVRVTGQETESSVVLTVADEGIGIAPEHHERVFKIFERLHAASAYAGTGIGLALVRRAVERMGGRVWVESELGAGARFFLELPKAGAH